MTKIGLVLMSLAFAIALHAKGPELEVVQLSPYDQSLGLPEIDDTGAASFKKPVRVSGQIRIERDDAEYCKGACAYFIPDFETLKRLPQRIAPRTKQIIQIRAIDLYQASTTLSRTLGEMRAAEILSPSLSVYEAPATATLNNFRVYVACGRTHYEAEVIALVVNSHLAQRSGKPEGSGC